MADAKSPFHGELAVVTDHEQLPRVDYDRLAANYDVRYSVRSLSGIAEALSALATACGAATVAEIGCGTGHWISALRSSAGKPHVYGVDRSPGMLQKAAAKDRHLPLVCADGNQLPFTGAIFDLIFCVNAVHHFDDPLAFIAQAASLLRPGGVLSVTTIDPRLISRWYLYEFFESARQTDLLRYPALKDLKTTMEQTGFQHAGWRVVETSTSSYQGREVLSDPFLSKDSNSLLALLTDDEYQAGLSKIEQAVTRGEAEGRSAVFSTELPFFMLTGSMPN